MALVFKSIPAELEFCKNELDGFLNVKDDIFVFAKKTDANGFCVKKNDIGVEISYCEKRDFFRALGFAQRVYTDGKSVSQSASFDTLCYMADMSRCAVLSVDGAKKFIRTLALMGYDSLMLYTEDTYEVPEYQYFGHMRGRYTKDELNLLDEYAKSFGIELIPCVQTLAHLENALRWKNVFGEISDTDRILLVDDEKTYDFIECMIKSLRECYSTKRIHIGMDEAHNLGLGKYLDNNGYQDRFLILSRHLARVNEICKKYDFEPMIWSDMYFRLYNHGKYYMSEGRIPQEIIDTVPKDVGLVYWDYYTVDDKTLDCMFENHKAFGNKVLFAGGAWKWRGLVPHDRFSVYSSRLHLGACIRHGCKDVIVTGWGDNGAEASIYSVLSTILLYAEACFDKIADDSELSVRFEELFAISYEDFSLIGMPNEIYKEPVKRDHNPPKYILYNAVLNGLMDMHIPEDASEKYGVFAKKLKPLCTHDKFGYMFDTIYKLCVVLELKANMSQNIYKAYNEGDRQTLKKYADEIIPQTIEKTNELLDAFRTQWFTENKSFGFDVHEIRIGGLIQLMRASANRISDYLDGKADKIEELLQPSLAVAPGQEQLVLSSFKNNISANII